MDGENTIVSIKHVTPDGAITFCDGSLLYKTPDGAIRFVIYFNYKRKAPDGALLL